MCDENAWHHSAKMVLREQNEGGEHVHSESAYIGASLQEIGKVNFTIIVENRYGRSVPVHLGDKAAFTYVRQNILLYVSTKLVSLDPFVLLNCFLLHIFTCYENI